MWQAAFIFIGLTTELNRITSITKVWRFPVLYRREIATQNLRGKIKRWKHQFSSYWAFKFSYRVESGTKRLDTTWLYITCFMTWSDLQMTEISVVRCQLLGILFSTVCRNFNSNSIPSHSFLAPNAHKGIGGKEIDEILRPVYRFLKDTWAKNWLNPDSLKLFYYCELLKCVCTAVNLKMQRVMTWIKTMRPSQRSPPEDVSNLNQQWALIQCCNVSINQLIN